MQELTRMKDSITRTCTTLFKNQQTLLPTDHEYYTYTIWTTVSIESEQRLLHTGRGHMTWTIHTVPKRGS